MKTKMKSLTLLSWLLLTAPAFAAPIYDFQPQPPKKVIETKRETAYPTYIGGKTGMRFLRTDYGSGNLGGLFDSELVLDGALRMNDWLLGLELSRWKASVNTSGVSERETPVWSLESAAYRLSLGKVIPWGKGEWTPMLLGQALLSTPSNGGVPYSGTPYDFNQSRVAFGLGAEFAQPFFCPCWTFKSGLDLFPWTSTRLDKSPYQLGWLGSGELNLGLTHAVSDLMAVELAYRGQLWSGSGLVDQSQRLTVGLSYRFLGSEAAK